MSVIAKMKSLSAAEEFFEFLSVPYDPNRLRVVRLHILKQLGSYLEAERLQHVPDDQALAECRQLLLSVYRDFSEHSPLERRVFKVLKDAVARKSDNFISLEQLKGSGSCTS
jgi:nitrogenase-stabilizing/protective protein